MSATLSFDFFFQNKSFFHLRLKNKLYFSKLPCAFVFRCAFDPAKFKLLIFFFFFFFCLNFFQFIMNSLVKIYMKRHDRHNKTLCTTDFFNSCVLSCILFIQNHILMYDIEIKFDMKSSSLFHTEKSCDRPKFGTSAAQKKKKKKPHTHTHTQKHLGQVFLSVTSFETDFFPF